MKLSLVNLVPLKEVEFDSPAPEGMDVPNFDSLVDALKWKNDLENHGMDIEDELRDVRSRFNDLLSGQSKMGAEPEGGPIQQKIAGELNQLKAREEKLKKELNTVLAKVDYFDQNYLGEGEYADRLANSGTDSDGRNTWGDKTGYSDEEMAQGKGKLKKYPDKDGRNVWGDKVAYSDAEKKAKGLNEEADYDGEGWDDPRDENGKLIVGDDGVISIGQLSLSKHAIKALNNGEHPSGLKYNAILDKKLEILKSLSASGKFKKDFSDDRFMDWLADNYSWAKIKKQFKKEFQEGSCGYGPDGVPGNTPGETQGMDADDRTRIMLRKLIQKEIAKHENK